ncbi:universal stress protein [Reyranella sp.]|jgi:nucleotide-binding universal stress UspA family protein|uniref:universal stress protein n=1 Tax=Reyranella sp. TaxID=1929291 RepID=UPI000BD5823E|nr:universal stress protein [Reyranella sp.]OYY47088.1 MAG: universal stress protein [Rhodospirillales bacterium 35-66-84]OYZ97108.1 MAG: universal stress protein [Rhodospirillales bacterium 24-66-33]OZB27565.1 MAG: universal stress protein [Rhodospirillales bacterium 39-66-50]HQS14022.1 universal stress protein [Reyranella sp.]HQT10507.1 universal stress protein [Reyranella sp.]
MFKHILIPTDGSPLSTTAVQKAMQLARDAGAKVTVVTVVEPFHVFSMDNAQIADTRSAYEQHARQAAERCLEDARRQAEAFGVPCEIMHLEQDLPYKAIMETATAKGCDLIAMASHGRRGAAALLLGSETAKVLTHSSIPVLVYR